MRVFDLSGLKDIFQVFAQVVMVFFQGLKRGRWLQNACLKDEGCDSTWWSHQQIEKEDFPEIQKDH